MAKMGEHGGEEAVTLPRGCNGLPTGVPIREMTYRTHSLVDRVHPHEAGCKEKMEGLPGLVAARDVGGQFEGDLRYLSRSSSPRRTPAAMRSMQSGFIRQYRAGVRQQAYRGKPGRPAKAAW